MLATFFSCSCSFSCQETCKRKTSKEIPTQGEPFENICRVKNRLRHPTRIRGGGESEDPRSAENLHADPNPTICVAWGCHGYQTISGEGDVGCSGRVWSGRGLGQRWQVQEMVVWGRGRRVWFKLLTSSFLKKSERLEMNSGWTLTLADWRVSRNQSVESLLGNPAAHSVDL